MCCGPFVGPFHIFRKGNHSDLKIGVIRSNAYKDKGIKVYFITTDWLDFEKEAITFLNKQGVKGISFIKEEGNDNNFINAISQEWSGTLPFTIVYDRHGNVSDYWEMKKDRFRFESAIIKAIGS